MNELRRAKLFYAEERAEMAQLLRVCRHRDPVLVRHIWHHSRRLNLAMQAKFCEAGHRIPRLGHRH